MKFRCAAILALALAPAALFAAAGSFDKTLTVHGPANLDISTGSGYIHVTPGPAGSIRIIGYVHSSTGWLSAIGLFSGPSEEYIRHITGNPPIMQNDDGIEVGRHTHFNNISIDYVVTAPPGTVVEANSGSGDLNITNLGAPLKAGTGSGDIFANDLSGDVALHTGSGSITAQMNGAHYVVATTGSGSIHLQRVSGGLNAGTGSGDIGIDGQPSAAWTLKTGSGSVILNTGSSRFTLDASTGSGGIHSDPPITIHGSLSHHHVTGDVNGGGPSVHVHTGSGDIRIH